MAETTKPKKQKRDWNAEGALPYENIPAFKAAYDFYKECQFRFRNVPVDAKPVARDIKAKVMRVMVCIVETNSLTKKDFAHVSQYSDNLIRQMVGWSTSEEKKTTSSDLFSFQQ